MFNDENNKGFPDEGNKYVKEEIENIELKLGPNLKKYFIEIIIK